MLRGKPLKRTFRKAAWIAGGGVGKYPVTKPGTTTKEVYREIYESFYDIKAADDDQDGIDDGGSDERWRVTMITLMSHFRLRDIY